MKGRKFGVSQLETLGVEDVRSNERALVEIEKSMFKPPHLPEVLVVVSNEPAWHSIVEVRSKRPGYC